MPIRMQKTLFPYMKRNELTKSIKDIVLHTYYKSYIPLMCIWKVRIINANINAVK